jgi:hypothetical protein
MRIQTLVVAALSASAGVVGLGTEGARAEVPAYQLVGSFSLGTGADRGPVDVLPDGRLIRVSGDGRIAVQTAVNAGTFATVGSIDASLLSTFGASFVKVSPSGQTVAIGDNTFGPGGKVLLVNAAAFSTVSASPATAVTVPNAEAAWSGEGTLFVSGFGSGSVLSRVDVSAGVATTVVTGIGDASGGVAVRDGRLYTGIGFDFSGPRAGEIRAFDLAALSGSGAVAFESGALIGDVLSAFSLGFDGLGNLTAGGGDFNTGDTGAAAVVDGAAVLAAALGGPPVTAGQSLRLSPAGPGGFYGTLFNGATGELLVIEGGTAYRYAVPTPAGVALLLCGLGVGMRRRRRA